MRKKRSKLNNLLKLEERVSFNISNGVKNKPLLKPLTLFTELGSSLGVTLIFILLTITSGVKVIYTLVPIYFLQLSVVELIKKFFKRPRPKHIIGANKNIFGMKATSGSFPSGHASNAFTIAFLISNFYYTSIETTVILFVVAMGIGISRIYLGKHYIIDVMGGAVIGLLLSTAGWIFINTLV